MFPDSAKIANSLNWKDHAVFTKIMNGLNQESDLDHFSISIFLPKSKGIDPVDSGIDPVDSGIDPVDSGIDPVDSGIDPVDSGIDWNDVFLAISRERKVLQTRFHLLRVQSGLISLIRPAPRV